VANGNYNPAVNGLQSSSEEMEINPKELDDGMEYTANNTTRFTTSPQYTVANVSGMYFLEMSFNVKMPGLFLHHL
jgi:hypothetical protein